MKNTSPKKKQGASKKAQLTEVEVPKGGLAVDVRIKDIEKQIFEEDETETRIHYKAVISPDYSIHAIYNGRGEKCEIKTLKDLDPKANIFSKKYRRYFIDLYGDPTQEVEAHSSH